jgi:hypothetical protein
MFAIDGNATIGNIDFTSALGYSAGKCTYTGATRDVFVGASSGFYAGIAADNTYVGAYSGTYAHNMAKTELFGAYSDVSLFVLGPVTRALGAGAGMGTGVYYYKYAWVFTINGVTVEGPTTLPFTITTTAGNNRVVHSVFPTYSGPLNCTGIKIYRTAVAGTYYGTFKLVDTAAGNPPANYTDVKADGALGATLVEHTGMMGMGYHSDVLQSNSIVIGSTESAFTDIWLGGGMYKATPSQVNLYATGGSGANNAGANLSIAGGQGTGSALGGSILFKTSPVGGGGSTWNDLVEVARFTGAGELLFATAKILDMYTNASCVLKAPYSAQSGFSAMAIGEVKVQKNSDTGKYYITAGCDDGIARGVEVTV